MHHCELLLAVVLAVVEPERKKERKKREKYCSRRAQTMGGTTALKWNELKFSS
jgi:hypothetical protein